MKSDQLHEGSIEMDFYGFLRTLRVSDTPRGDFVRDIRLDVENMRAHFGGGEPASWNNLRGYLRHKGACDEACAVAARVWRQYLRKKAAANS